MLASSMASMGLVGFRSWIIATRDTHNLNTDLVARTTSRITDLKDPQSLHQVSPRKKLDPECRSSSTVRLAHSLTDRSLDPRPVKSGRVGSRDDLAGTNTAQIVQTFVWFMPKISSISKRGVVGTVVVETGGYLPPESRVYSHWGGVAILSLW